MKDLLAQSWRNLVRSRTRTALTVLGIVWGIMTVTVLLAYGSGFRRILVYCFRSVGNSVAIVWPGQTSEQAGGERAGRRIRLEKADREVVLAEASLVKAVSLETVSWTDISYGDRMANTAIRGVYPEYGYIRNEVASDGEMQRRVVEGSIIAATFVLFGCLLVTVVPAIASTEAGWQSAVLEYLGASQSLSAGEINKILRRHSHSIDTLPRYLHSPGSEFSAAVRDMDHDGKDDVVISRIQSAKQMALYIIASRNQWNQQGPVLFPLPIEPRLAREVRVLFLDMNNDGVEDILVRTRDGAQRAQSIDCIAVMPSVH